MSGHSKAADSAVRALREASAIRARVSDAINHRALAMVTAVEGCGYASFVTLLVFLAYSGETAFPGFPLIVLFMLGMQLARGLRESYGFVSLRLRILDAVLAGVCVVSLGLAWLAHSQQVTLSPVVLCVPGVVILVVFLLHARSEWRRGDGPGARVGRERQPFSVGLRLCTAAIGVILGALTATTTIPAVSALLAMLAFILLLGWMGFSSSRGLSLAEAWGTFAWTVFGIATISIGGLTVLAMAESLPIWAAVGAGAAVAVLFAIAAVLPSKNA